MGDVCGWLYKYRIIKRLLLEVLVSVIIYLVGRYSSYCIRWRSCRRLSAALAQRVLRSSIESVGGAVVGSGGIGGKQRWVDIGREACCDGIWVTGRAIGIAMGS